jgi:hypothetical protein
VTEPDDEWTSEFLELMGALDEELERPPSKPIGEQKDPFD